MRFPPVPWHELRLTRWAVVWAWAAAAVRAMIATAPAAGAPKARGGFVYWRALCLSRAGMGTEAVRLLDLYVRDAGPNPQARAEGCLLAADLLVHERLDPQRARSCLQVVIKEQTAAQAEVAWRSCAARPYGHICPLLMHTLGSQQI